MTFLYLVSLGTVHEDILGGTEACLAHTFGFPMRRMRPLEEPAYAYDPQRRQYSWNPILNRLGRVIPPDAARLLALTEKDLFVPILTFVFGQAQLQGPIAIVSTARLRQEFYDRPPEMPLLVVRAAKEALHEMGHTFGLVHCPDPACPMSLSANLRQVDDKGIEFCPSCKVLVRERPDRICRPDSGSNQEKDRG